MVWQQVGIYARDNADKWATKDIVYVSIIGTVMLAAFLEWFLWLAAFMYCLVKVFQKAETISVRILSVIMMILFCALRAIFLPIMVVTLPLPAQVTQHFPQAMVSFLQWFAFWAFAGLLTIPWLLCVYQLVTHSIGRTKRIKTVLDESSAPKVVIIMPCYNEAPDILLRTCDSLVDCDYPPSCLHIFLSFDGDEENELYLNTIEKLGVPLTLDSYPKSIDVTYRSCRITVSRFPHGGKRHCQKRTYRLIDKIYAEYLKRNDNLFVLFIDSDCILDKVCIQNFMYEMELKPGSKKNMLAMTGVITSTTEKNSLITILQDMEYIHGQLFERSVESGCGAVTCLPGALTILRFSAFRRMAKFYFADKAEQCDDLFDYGKCHLGEDRWLTHLFMIGAQERYQIQMNPGAFCKTEAVQSYRSLLKQRRRWFLGFITNEVCMLTDIRLWRRYPVLCIVRFMQNTIRTTALLFFIMVLSIVTTSQKVANLPVGFIAISLGLNWVLMLYFGAKLGRYKIMLYPIMFVINPFFNWVYMVYGIFTAGQRTWGGPRADAGAADTGTTAQQAIEQAEAAGDDLNVVPETFKAAAAAQKHRPAAVPLQPSDQMEGRFAPAAKLPGGWYQQANDSGLILPNMMPRNPNGPNVALNPRASMDSFVSTVSNNNSVYMPRRVESIMDPEDARMYHKTQANQRPAGGAYFEAERQVHNSPYEVNAGPNKSPYHESVESLGDESMYHGLGKQPQRPAQSRHESDERLSNSPITPTGNSPLSKEYGNSGLEIPKAAHNRPGHRDSSGSVGPNSRQGRSPLARASFVRTAPGQELGMELQQQQQQQRSLLRDVSPAPLASPLASPLEQPQLPNHERSDSRDSKRRKRLTKNPPGGSR
ncbi:glycosyltransferase family 2 protein [Melanomma pulvis-pyrius CBS 109.77]|uniref:chitin synthase n=1 Tax=Melanomma pulvis-pyrius CBS 109.77 TaxID=1314802 RepID=A0A6A6WZF4_9PLEO|nr:glycosyltransferase family 2 protein [Melanomma pulvis-pyrius CBS 109.77]